MLSDIIQYKSSKNFNKTAFQCNLKDRDNDISYKRTSYILDYQNLFELFLNTYISKTIRLTLILLKSTYVVYISTYGRTKTGYNKIF